MPMPEPRRLLTKVVLAGDQGVGKTSLVRRYVVDAFDDRYLLTLGTKVEKKVVDVAVPERDLRASLSMQIWDIMGQRGFRELAKEAYFFGARGIFAVADLTRKDTLDGVGDWVRAVHDVTGPIPMVLVANKKDLLAQAAYTRADVEAEARKLGCVSFLASAKTGENVEPAFQQLATLIVRAYLKV
jgi:small GTP-binding protein